MSGYIYCMMNDHRRYGNFVKIGYTERSPYIRRDELSEKWHCNFLVIWELEVYEPARAEKFIHRVLDEFRQDYEFFNISAEQSKQLAEHYFDERWREIEGKEVLPPSLVELANDDAFGILIKQEHPECNSAINEDID